MGPDRQEFGVVFDTGSSDVWVVDSSCNLPVCETKRKYIAHGTEVPSTIPFYIRYGTGEVHGRIYSEPLQLAPGLVLADHTVAMASSITPFFQRVPIDGIVGLGFSRNAANGMKTVLDGLLKHAALPRPIFSFYLSSHPGDDKSEILFGDINSKLFNSSLKWTPVVSDRFVRARNTIRPFAL